MNNVDYLISAAIGPRRFVGVHGLCSNPPISLLFVVWLKFQISPFGKFLKVKSYTINCLHFQTNFKRTNIQQIIVNLNQQAISKLVENLRKLVCKASRDEPR